MDQQVFGWAGEGRGRTDPLQLHDTKDVLLRHRWHDRVVRQAMGSSRVKLVAPAKKDWSVAARFAEATRLGSQVVRCRSSFKEDN